MDHKTVLLRSWMFVPGDRQKMIDKAVALPVDAILLDIEDGVAPAATATARKQIAESLDRLAVQQKEKPSYRTPARHRTHVRSGGLLQGAKPSSSPRR